MHATTEQLLSARDGTSLPPAAEQHIAACAACRGEVQRLRSLQARMKAMPEIRPPHDLWQTVAVNAVTTRAARRVPWAAITGFAASFALAMVLILRMGPEVTGDPVANSGNPTDVVASTPAPAREAVTPDLLQRSQRLEAALRALPAAPSVTRASTAMTIADLEDQLMLVDARLSSGQLTPQQEETLWRHRVRLMDSLVRLRYVQINDAR
ncbi:MAG: hypothetical protein P8080_04730 [Gammaproteobacteria bacterium]